MKRRNEPTAIQKQLARLASSVSQRPAVSQVPRKPPSNLVSIEGGKRQIKVTAQDLASARRRTTRTGSVPPAELNPFQLPKFPKAAVPATATLAQDSDLAAIASYGTTEWAASAAGYAYNSAFFEGVTFLGYTYLAQLAQRPEYRKISERIATDMTRKWIKLKASSASATASKTKSSDAHKDGAEDPEAAGRQAAQEVKKSTVDQEKAAKIKIIENEMKRLKVRDRFREVAEQDGFFGRSHLYVRLAKDEAGGREELQTSIGDGRSAATKMKVSPKNPVIELRTVEPVWCYPMGYNATDPLSTEWYNPQLWNVMGKMIHRSRIMPFVGREVPDMLKPAYAFGGLALTQMAKPYVDNWLRTRQSVSDLVHAFSVNGLKCDMSQNLAPEGNQLFARLDLFNLLRDNRGVFAIDKNAEEFFQFNTPLGTLDKLQAQAQEQMASVVNIPLIVLLGITPTGLNASSEGEIRVYYDWIEAFQEKLFSDALTTIIDFIQLSKFGKIDPEIVFEFEPLWSMTRKEQAEVDKFEAEADQVRIDSGVIHPIEARQRLASDAGSPYESLDVDDVPEPPADPMDPGGDGEPGDDGSGEGGGSEADSPFDGAKDAAWEESKHPRDDGGQFSETGGGGALERQHGSNHGRPDTLGGSNKSVKHVDYKLVRDGEEVATIKSTKAMVTSGSEGSRVASSRGEKLRYRAAITGSAEPARYFDKEK